MVLLKQEIKNILRSKIWKIKYLTWLPKWLILLLLLLKKIRDHSKYFTTSEFNKLTAKIFPARLTQASLANKNNIANCVKKANFYD